MTRTAVAKADPAPARGARGLRRGGAAARRLRVAVSVLLLLVSGASFVAGVGLLVLRRELRSRVDGDTRPCPSCRSPAILDGRSLVDEQGQRLLFATPEDAARYAADYAKAREEAREGR